MTRVREIIEQAVETVSRELEDPNSYRSNKNERWVFDHFPKYDNKNKPRIGFYKGPAGHSQKQLGSIKADIEADMNCGIFVSRNNSYDFDDDGVNEPPEDLIDYLASEIKYIVEEYQNDFTSIGDDVYYVKLNDSNNPVKPENQSWIFQQLTFEVKLSE